MRWRFNGTGIVFQNRSGLEAVGCRSLPQCIAIWSMAFKTRPAEAYVANDNGVRFGS